MFNIQFSIRHFILAFAFSFCTFIVSGQEIKAVKATDVEKIIAESKTPLIINFWASWCKPCIEEIPYFQEEVKKHSKDSLQLILVSLDFKEDFPDEILSVAKKRKFIVPLFWLDETNADYFCPKVDPQWSGGLPATLFINNKTGYRKFFEEKVSKEKLKEEIRATLQLH
ncbi:MAG: redoxin domain-containing protein [Sphingobacteriales bacterium]|nr:redoxin domain-containing protein [Sphingobacteriales bacterium]